MGIGHSLKTNPSSNCSNKMQCQNTYTNSQFIYSFMTEVCLRNFAKRYYINALTLTTYLVSLGPSAVQVILSEHQLIGWAHWTVLLASWLVATAEAMRAA